MAVVGGVLIDLDDVKRAHTYQKKNKYHLYIKFKDRDEVTINYDLKDECEEAFKFLRKSYGLYTDAEQAEMDKKAAEEAAKKAKEVKEKPLPMVDYSAHTILTDAVDSRR
jgi:hypothetical protein